MLKVTIKQVDSFEAWELEGKLSGDWVKELERCWKERPSPTGVSLQVHLKAVTYIDATSLTPKERRPYLKIARERGCSIEALYFDVPLEVCKARNAGRGRVVPDAAMDALAGKLVAPTVAEGFDRVTVVGA